MKHFLFLLALSVSFLTKAQSFIIKTPTFIGKTQDEVLEINKAYKNKLAYSHTDSMLTTYSYEDATAELNYDFMFSKNKICVAYLAQTDNKSTKDTLMKEISQKCAEKLSDKAWLQKLDGKNYVWTLQGTDSFFAVSVSQSK